MARRRTPTVDSANIEKRMGREWRQAVRELGFSRQQARVIELVMRGKADKEIAAELSLSKHTVRTYLKRMFARLEVTDRNGLVLGIVAVGRLACPYAKCPYKQ
jgi:DNA-binding NarL/FixJ family response regulator